MAGRELDALVAQEVMGKKVVWRKCLESWGKADDSDEWTKPKFVDVPCEDDIAGALGYADFDGGFSYKLPEVPRFSFDIKAAWQVMEKLRERGFTVSVWLHPEHPPLCEVGRPGDIEPPLQIEADTAPVAICLAALKAVE